MDEPINWMTLEQIRDEYVKIIQQNKDLILEYKNALDCMEEISLEINKKRSEDFKQDKEVDSFVKSLLGARLIKLFSTAGANYRLFTGGFIVESYANTRTSFELIISIYFDLKYPKKTEIIFKKERPISCQAMMDSLYDDSKNETLMRLYSELCHHTHSSIKSISPIYDIQPDMLKDVFDVAMMMLYATQIIFIELQKEYLSDEQITRLFSSMESILQNLYAVPDFIPDKIKSKIYFIDDPDLDEIKKRFD